MANQAPVTPDPAQVAAAEEGWRSFGQAIKISIICIAVILIALALAFTDL